MGEKDKKMRCGKVLDVNIVLLFLSVLKVFVFFSKFCAGQQMVAQWRGGKDRDRRSRNAQDVNAMPLFLANPPHHHYDHC